jgi:uncharacterized protein YbjT (DUF2867 family)
MILVAGGTGRLGAVLVPRLTTRGEQVRVLTRAPSRAAHLTGVEVVVGDVRRPADLAPAVRGVTAVVSAVHGFAGPGHVSPESVDRDGNAHLIDAARSVGARVVLLSVIGAAPTHPLGLFRMKAAAEEALQRSSLPWTIVRSGAFLEFYQDLMRRSAGRSGRPIVPGRGTNPVQFCLVAEVAAAVETALRDSASKVVELDGPTMTMNEVAASAVSDVTSRGRPPRHVPRAVLRGLAVARSSPVGRQAQAALVMDTYDLRTGQPAQAVPGTGLKRPTPGGTFR